MAKSNHKKNNKPRSKYRFKQSDIVVCPVCNTEKTCEEWDRDTFSRCTTRETKRDFRSITTYEAATVSSTKDDMYYYLCLNCNSLIVGHALHKRKCDCES